MPAEILLVHTNSLTTKPLARWEMVRALRNTSPLAYGLVRDYPWVTGCSPLSRLERLPPTATGGLAYVARWDHHGAQEELYVTLFILDALVRAIPDLCARLLCHRPTCSDVPVALANTEPAAEDVLLLELSSAIEACADFDRFLRDCGTDDFSYETDLVGRLWLLPGGGLGVVPTGSDVQQQGSLVHETYHASSHADAAPWCQAMDASFAHWLRDTALPAGCAARHTLVVAVPPVVAGTLHHLTTRECHAVLLHHTAEYPLVVSTGASSSSVSVVPAQGRFSRWWQRLPRDAHGDVQQRQQAHTESVSVSSLCASFTVQAQSGRLVRVPLRGLSRFLFVLLLCAPVPSPMATTLPTLALAASTTPQPLTIEALQLGFQVTWALARFQRDAAEGVQCPNTEAPHMPVLHAILRAAAKKAHTRVAALTLPAEQGLATEAVPDPCAITALERELFLPDHPSSFRGSSDAWVAEAVASVQREFLRPTPPGEAVTVDDAAQTHAQYIARALEVDHDAHRDEDTDDGEDNDSESRTTASAGSSSSSAEDDGDRYVNDVLREMETVKNVVQGPPRRGDDGNAAASAFLDNKPLMDVMELLSKQGASSSV